MNKPLAGLTVAVLEHRQLDDLVELLEEAGAVTYRCPMVAIVDNPDRESILAWLRRLLGGEFDLVILMTGEAVRRLVSFAEHEGLGEAFLRALAQTRKLTRGPKPVQALRALGLETDYQAANPTTAGVISFLDNQDIKGKCIGVTLYGQPNRELRQYLESRGALVYEVMPYIYTPASDTRMVTDLIRRLASGQIHAIMFTSSPQADHLFELARKLGLESELRTGLDKTWIAAVGPVVQKRLYELGVHVDVAPSRGFVMKNLVHQMAHALANRSSPGN
jgi:uroporphyrinogen-III synthase